VNAIVRSAIAQSMEPLLNEHMARLPQASCSEKQALAKWVNAELRELGLAIRCPKTGTPAYLMGSPVLPDQAGRFQLEIRQENSGRRHRTLSSVTLPHLTLMAEDPRRKLGIEEPRSGRER